MGLDNVRIGQGGLNILMSVTHALISATGAMFVLGESSPLLVGVSILGSQLPDVDTTESAMGKLLFPIAKWIQDRYPHRTITHSFLFSLMLAIAMIPVYVFSSPKIAIALPLGHLLAILSDTFTKQGVQLFWPSPIWCICGKNPNGRLSTGSTGEFWLIGIICIALAVVLNMQSSGGLMVHVDRIMGLQDGVVKVFNDKGKTHHVFVKVDGVLAKDRSPVSKEFFLIGAGQKQLVLVDSKGLYKTESDILPHRMISRVGQPATIKIDALSFNEEELFSKLVDIYQANKNSLIYLSGSLTVDSPEEIEYVPTPGQLSPLTVNGNTVVLEYCPIQLAGKSLVSQFVTGQLETRIIYPAPNLEDLK